MQQQPNKLINETSPYLLQHAYNPVQWYPWGTEALEKSKEENKPILVSIGYAACHWCHVMERESFENETVAGYMNEHFINIKIDREERPDLDHIYMDAVQAMTGSGGWPLNVFLTPEAKPFYGGTYFPPVRAYNRASWLEVLAGVVEAYREKQHEIQAQAENLTSHLLQANAFGLRKDAEADTIFTKDKMQEAAAALMKIADKTWGGFGAAPKFPQTSGIQFLLRCYYNNVTTWKKEPFRDTVQLKDQALLSLDKMLEGGIYDQLGGGFARYATDKEWLAPHFEKMLYDNALLVSVLSEAYQLTGLDKYKQGIVETIAFVQKELMHPAKAFYAAIDADSEGEEGKFYVWSYEEVEQVLGKDTDVFAAFFDSKPEGNWEGKNILRRLKSAEQVATEKRITVAELFNIIKRGKEKMLARREKRAKPLLDDKVILSWNALMNTALSKAYAATGSESYRELAIDNMIFLLEHFSEENEGPSFYHTWKNGKARYPAFLDDYAFLIQALLLLQEITAETKWLNKAYQLTQYVIENFSDEENQFFFYTTQGQPDIIVRKKEVYDGAQPSGNAVMADNLYRLSILMENPDWKERSQRMLLSLGQAIVRYPSSFGCWACLLLEMATRTTEIVVTGENYEKGHEKILSNYLPQRVFMAAPAPLHNYPLLAGKKFEKKSFFYLCSNYACLQPVSTPEELISLINSS